jgi:peptide/nickel transport system permease protein
MSVVIQTPRAKWRFKPTSLPKTLIFGGLILIISLLLAFFPSLFAPYRHARRSLRRLCRRHH